MYGLLLDAIQKFLREKYGESYWINIRRRAKLKNHWFVTHEVYSEGVIPSLVDAASEELGEDKDNVMSMFGQYFAENIGRYGYARLLRVLGRDMRDFFNGLVDLHEYLRFSYPHMSPPSFFCSDETPNGLYLHYITKRKGFLCYVMGQIKVIGKIYGKEVEINLMTKEETESEVHFVLDLKFDNVEMLRVKRPSVTGFADFHIDSTTFFDVFPFSFVFSEDMVIRKVGNKLHDVLPGLFGDVLNHAFTLQKPYLGQLDWENILLRTNCTFELHSVRRVQKQVPLDASTSQAPFLKLKGQMMLLPDVGLMAFLCSPAMDSPEDLYECGIFISDLSLHNCSREFIMAGSQKHPELNIAFSQEKIRSAQLETSIKKTDELLYQMIPKLIADKLRNGEPPLSTCQEFESVSILFSDIVSFTPMCSRLAPMEVVCVLNSVCTAYDRLCEKHNVYKVEMIGDAYMVLAGGPVPSPHHAESITNYGLGILEETAKIIDPSTNSHLKIRVGIHSGGVVAGVVGNTTQRYDVFGDTVNIAARMESTGEPMRIQVSSVTAALLQGRDFIVVERGQVEVKGKGLMKTFWVNGKKPSAAKDGGPRMTPRPSIVTGNMMSHQKLVTSTPTTPARRSSPAPDEWPEADRRLSDTYHYQHPSFKTHRSYTLPNIDITPMDSDLRAMLCPYSHNAGLTGSSLSSPQSPEHRAHSHNRVSTGYLEPGLERNHLRHSVSQGLATINELEERNLSELVQFATMAEENARHARRLADAAKRLLRSRSGELCPQVHVQEDSVWDGSPVDPPTDQSIPITLEGRSNYCTIL